MENSHNNSETPEIMPDEKIGCGKKKHLITLIAFILVITIILGAAAYLINFIFAYNYNEIDDAPEQLGFEEVKDERIINIALFGIDTRSPESFEGNSDAIMILSVNTKTNKIKLISVMRDSLVPIETEKGVRHNKINNAYATGGPELAIKTLNTIFDMDISEYVAVNFFKLADIIDAIGGVEINVTKSELYYLNACASEIDGALGKKGAEYKVTSAGTQLLNGIQATAYARIRYAANAEGTTNDYGRTDRQRLVMEQMLNKVLAMEKTEYTKLIKPILACCETSLTYSEAIDVALKLLSSKPTFEETRVPQENFLMPSPNAGVGSTVYYDLNFAAKLIHAFIYDDTTPETFIETNGIEKNNWYATGFVPIDIKHFDEKEDSSATESTEEQ